MDMISSVTQLTSTVFWSRFGTTETRIGYSGTNHLLEHLFDVTKEQEGSAKAVLGHLLQLSAMSEDEVEQRLQAWSDMLAENRTESKESSSTCVMS